MEDGFKSKLYEDYRKKFGCKNTGELCWCEICVNIETLIEDVINSVVKDIHKLTNK